jgi:hypothetical protein
MTKEPIDLIKGYLLHKVDLLIENSIITHSTLEEYIEMYGFSNLNTHLKDGQIKLIVRTIEDLNFDDDWDLIEWLAEYQFGQIMSLDELKAALREDPYGLKYETYEKLYSEHIDIFDYLIGLGLAIKREKE